MRVKGLKRRISHFAKCQIRPFITKVTICWQFYTLSYFYFVTQIFLIIGFGVLTIVDAYLHFGVTFTPGFALMFMINKQMPIIKGQCYLNSCQLIVSNWLSVGFQLLSVVFQLVVSCFSVGCQLVVSRLSVGCQSVVSWLSVGYQLFFSWLSAGCQLVVSRLSVGF